MLPLRLPRLRLPREHLRLQLKCMQLQGLHPWTRRQFSSKVPDLPLFRALRAHNPAATAVVASTSTFRYGQLLRDVVRSCIESQWHSQGPGQGPGQTVGGLKGRRAAFLMENNYDYVGELESVPCEMDRVTGREGGG